MDITLFEIHLDGAQFGPARIGDEMMGKMSGMGKSDEMSGMDEGSEMDGEATGEWESVGRSRSPVRFLPVVLGIGVAAGYVAYRRFRGGTEEIDVDAEPVEIEA